MNDELSSLWSVQPSNDSLTIDKGIQDRLEKQLKWELYKKKIMLKSLKSLGY